MFSYIPNNYYNKNSYSPANYSNYYNKNSYSPANYSNYYNNLSSPNNSYYNSDNFFSNSYNPYSSYNNSKYYYNNDSTYSSSYNPYYNSSYEPNYFSNDNYYNNKSYNYPSYMNYSPDSYHNDNSYFGYGNNNQYYNVFFPYNINNSGRMGDDISIDLDDVFSREHRYERPDRGGERFEYPRRRDNRGPVDPITDPSSQPRDRRGNFPPISNDTSIMSTIMPVIMMMMMMFNINNNNEGIDIDIDVDGGDNINNNDNTNNNGDNIDNNTNGEGGNGNNEGGNGNGEGGNGNGEGGNGNGEGGNGTNTNTNTNEKQDPVSGGGEVWGDPHFVGSDGGEYDVMGEAGKVYNILSDLGLQVNSRFSQWDKKPNANITVMTELGITSGNSFIKLDALNDVFTFGGAEIPEGITDYDDTVIERKKDGNKNTFIITSGEYQIEVKDRGGHFDVGFSSNNVFSDSVMPHGLWGLSVDGDGNPRNGDKGKGAQGGGAIEKLDGTMTEKGDKETYKLYEVSGLGDTSFDNFNRFSGMA